MVRSLPLSDMIQSLFGVRTLTRENPLVDVVGVAIVQILPASPNRVGMVLFNLSANTIYVAPNNRVAATHGIRLAANGGSISLTWDKDFEAITLPWYGIATGVDSDIYILEYMSQ